MNCLQSQGSRCPPLLHLPFSPSIPCAQASARSHSSCPRSSKQSRHSKQAKDISDLKSQMAQVLEYLVRQQAINPALAPAQPPALVPALPLALAAKATPLAPEVAPVVSKRDEAMSTEDNDAISIESSWDGDSLECPNPGVQELTKEAGPSSEAPSETDISPPSSSGSALMERASSFLQVPWKTAPEQPVCVQTGTSFNPPTLSVDPGFSGGGQVLLAETPDSAPSVSKSAAPLAFPMVTRTVPIPTVPLADLRHRLQTSVAANT
ncbi:UNVERIFIED_CONTAM: hypothetical protein FKN15_071150 [Acipenser sinensis]